MCQVQVPANVRAGTLSLLTGALEIKPLMLQVTPVFSAEMSQKYQLRKWWLIGGFSVHRRRATRLSKGRIFIPPPGKNAFFSSSHYCGGMLLH